MIKCDRCGAKFNGKYLGEIETTIALNEKGDKFDAILCCNCQYDLLKWFKEEKKGGQG